MEDCGRDDIQLLHRGTRLDLAQRSCPFLRQPRARLPFPEREFGGQPGVQIAAAFDAAGEFLLQGCRYFWPVWVRVVSVKFNT